MTISQFELSHRIAYTICIVAGGVFSWLGFKEEGASILIGLGSLLILGGLVGHIWFARSKD